MALIVYVIFYSNLQINYNNKENNVKKQVQEIHELKNLIGSGRVVLKEGKDDIGTSYVRIKIVEHNHENLTEDQRNSIVDYLYQSNSDMTLEERNIINNYLLNMYGEKSLTNNEISIKIYTKEYLLQDSFQKMIDERQKARSVLNKYFY